jgi:catechol 2,3-dioxygenase-like lactoylglutathione lyase family enzyme
MLPKITGCRLAAVAAALAAFTAPAVIGAAEGGIDKTSEVFSLSGMNIFRRFAVEEATAAEKAGKMFEFYGVVLGHRQQQTFNVGAGANNGSGVTTFEAGAQQVKLTRRTANKNYVPGGVKGATGVRLLTFFYPDEQALSDRFAEHGYARPEFKDYGGKRIAVVDDPDGQQVELVIAPSSPEAYERIEVGLTVSDLEESLGFYRNFVGLEELPPQDDPVFGTTVYPFRNGTTTVELRHFGGDLPADTGSGGIQYVVSDVEAVNALAMERAVTIDQPLSTLAGFSLRTVWLDDPDGITNYFAQPGVRTSQNTQ